MLLDRKLPTRACTMAWCCPARSRSIWTRASTRPTEIRPVPKSTILQAIEDHPDAQLLVLTSCTYDGPVLPT